MRHTDARILIDRGRKAGLGTGELYRAIAARPPEGSDLSFGRTDGNGFVSVYDVHGQRTYRPADAATRR